VAGSSNKYNLTKREKEIMEVLWASPKSLVASEIAKEGGGMSLNTVQAILRKLLKNGLIKVNEIVYSGTVLSRSYIPTISPEKFEIQRLLSEQKDITTSRFVATMLEQEQEPEKMLNEINELETLLKAKRKELLGE
jgi:predicted transcriptional regulator